MLMRVTNVGKIFFIQCVSVRLSMPQPCSTAQLTDPSKQARFTAKDDRM